MRRIACLPIMLTLTLFFSAAVPTSAQSGMKIEISDIDVQAFPTIRFSLGAWDSRDQFLSDLKPLEFDIIEDNTTLRKPESATLQEKLGRLRISVVTDLVAPNQMDAIQKLMCVNLVNGLVLDQQRGADEIEVWIPGTGSKPALEFTNNSGVICNYITDTLPSLTPPPLSRLTFNEILQLLLTRQSTGVQNLIFVVNTRETDQSLITNQRVLERRGTRPVYVFSFMDTDKARDDWNFLVALASSTREGYPAAVDMHQPSARQEQRAMYLIQDSARFKQRYLIQYQSSLPRSELAHSLKVQIKSDRSPEASFIPYQKTPNDMESRTALGLGATITVILLAVLGLVAWSYRNNSSFTWP